MAANNIEALAVNKLTRAAIRKGKKIAGFYAPPATVMPTSITTGNPPQLAELTGFRPMGLVTKDDGFTKSRDRDISDIFSAGFQDPSRSDTTQDIHSVQVVAQETNRLNIEASLNVDLSTFTPDPVTGEVSFPQPTEGIIPQGRWVFLAQDGIGTGRYWWGWGFSAGVVKETDDQTVGTDDDGFYWPYTVSSQVDPALGWSVYHYFGGPGWRAALASMGFPAVS
ncbi:hypothetical protein GCM10023201_40940 [Actinomycetospora corticicola]|uniref:Uncharacterized protein n=1 Tax=Actinomycetospora corticicola TaxID=663602 RepID=A0A7Y9DWI4_9PSEU|nr:hypothetical protein [Actinomycetospora corticicola]NYD36822.1 hypothetical protein [Actinomycetospora corticicola]